ncbi:phenylalanyl-tRNA synthetase subunit beta [uncultured Tateyamaria sp.]|uniref:phenylalanyl-tRNA synthetase subunit beta n=1 Tax=uncultured Tateyamaria sp. TaxID=455651 RepID=UPI002639404A|nr:phenylalanyl-tRNA synthetase subunit beta [uncultured Tateyamaria sp.]
MTKYIVVAMIVLIVIAHIFLWRSSMDPALKLTFTVINATAWTIILGPVFFVDRWMKATRAKNAENNEAGKDVVT